MEIIGKDDHAIGFQPLDELSCMKGLFHRVVGLRERTDFGSAHAAAD
jgi:hypothetical protein